jgi:predicted nuclease of predicted toxin-antitoxin system
VKFLVDMPLPPALAHWLATQGHDAVHASTLGLDRATDSQILTRARQDARTVVTADLDYPRLLAVAGAEGPSLIFFRGGDWSASEAIARMQQIFRVMGESEVTHSIVAAPVANKPACKQHIADDCATVSSSIARSYG